MKYSTKKNPDGTKKHYLYGTFCRMKQRCYDVNCTDYKDYGGRGIKVSGEWLESFFTFLEDMGDRPKGHSIDRIDNNGNYCKENCRWATHLQQAKNKSTNNKDVGVTFDKNRNKWIAIMNFNNIRVLYKRFDRYEDAVKERQRIEKKCIENKDGTVTLKS